MARDYYSVLGVSRKASDKDIRRAYRRLARQYHPDVNRADGQAETRFKEINEAYQVLSDPEKRRKYDQFGENWRYADQFAAQGAAAGSSPFGRASRGRRYRRSTLDDMGGGLGDLFGDAFGDLGDLFGTGRGRGRSTAGSRRRSPSLEHPVEVTLEEAFHGSSRALQVETPEGGVTRLEVRIPPGVDTGSRVHVPNQRVGDLYLVVTVRPHERFQRQGADLTVEVAVALTDAILGAEVKVPTPGGAVALKIPPETQNGRVFRLAGQGMPRLGRPGERGNLHARVRVTLPTGLSDRERELFEELRKSRDGR